MTCSTPRSTARASATPAFASSSPATSGRARVDGWEGGLRLIVDNLLDNAALHGRGEGGSVKVGLERDEGRLVVRVEDDGPGSRRTSASACSSRSPAAATRAPDGTGLGLAIVAQQAALHGGDLELGDAPGGGLAVEVRLPAREDEPEP